jgi:5S rRNA maturation endonuclease (ribonuclease M5)
VARYEYKDADDKPSYEVIRFEPKTFRQRRFDSETQKYVPGVKDVTPLPYNLPQIIKEKDKTIYIVEGERDVECLKEKGLLATCNSGGAGNWNPALNKYFQGRDIVILPDFDSPGKQHGKTVASHLHSVAKSIKIIELPRLKEKEDPTDFFLNGGTVEELNQCVNSETEIVDKVEEPQVFEGWKVIDPLTIPPRDFLYRDFTRSYCSLLVSPGGIGKSALSLVDAVAMASNRNLLGIKPSKEMRVIYYNSEDPLQEIQRRVLGILQHYGVDQSEIENKLFLASGRDADLELCQGIDGAIQEQNFDLLERFCVDNHIDVLMLDPLVNMLGGASENDNALMGSITKRLSVLADKCELATVIVHHTRKANGREMSVEDSRGGIALVSGCRSASVLQQMDNDFAVKHNLEPHKYFSLNNGKANLKPLAKQTWFEKISVDLINGDQVAVVVPFDLPDVFSGVTTEMARQVQIRCNDADPGLKHHYQASSYVGKTIAEVLGLTFDRDKQKIAEILKTWIKNDVLAVVDEIDKRQSREVKVVRSGSVNPLVVG